MGGEDDGKLEKGLGEWGQREGFAVVVEGRRRRGGWEGGVRGEGGYHGSKEAAVVGVREEEEEEMIWRGGSEDVGGKIVGWLRERRRLGR